MKNTLSISLIAALIAALALADLAQAKADPSSGSAELSVTVQSDPDARPRGDAKPAGPGLDIRLEFDGQVRWASPRLRVDLTEKSSGESVRLQADVESGKALMLYPDTLNGYKGDIASIDQFGYLRQFAELMKKGGEAPAPAGWKREAVGSEKVGTVKCTKYKLTGPKGGVVHWWVDGNSQPRRIQTVRGGMRVRVDIVGLNYEAKVPASVFEYGKEFSISEMQPGSKPAGV
jgi:hypothetical protein